MFYNKQKGGFPSLNIPGASDMLGGAQMPMMDAPEMQTAPMQDPKMPPAIKPKAFGKGGKAWKILGIIGDALQTAGGGRATYMPAMLDLQEKVDAERKWQAQLDQQMRIAELSRQPKTWQDNAGNMWREGETSPFFIDRAPKMSLASDGIGGLRMVPQENPYLTRDLPKVNSPEDVSKLPPGSQFIAPDGSIRTVPGGPTASQSGGFR